MSCNRNAQIVLGKPFRQLTHLVMLQRSAGPAQVPIVPCDTGTTEGKEHMSNPSLKSAHIYPGTKPVSIREAHKQMTRERLIQASIAVIDERGFESASIDEIATRANVGRTTVYKYFHGMSDIAAAIGERHRRQFIDSLAAMKLVEPGSIPDLDVWLTQFEVHMGEQASWNQQGRSISEGLASSLLMMEEAADEVLEAWFTRGWVPAVAAPTQSLKLLFNLVGRTVSYHKVFGVPEAEHNREALLELVNCELTRIVRRRSPI